MSEKYEIVRKIYTRAKEPHLNFYLARDLESSSVALDLILDGETYGTQIELQEMSALALRLEEEHPKVHSVVVGTSTEGLKKIEKNVENPKLHYDWLFPRVKDIVVDDSEAYRKLLVLEAVDSSYGDYIFLDSVIESGLKLDLRTSAWIYGRFLKFDQFMSLAQKIYVFDRSNVLIEPTKHRMMFLDYSSVRDSHFMSQFSDEMPEDFEEFEYEKDLHDKCRDWSDLINRNNEALAEQINANAREASKFIVELLGFNPVPEELAKISDEETHQYLAFVAKWLNHSCCGSSGLYEAPDDRHREFYKLIDGLWGRQYHPFTTIKK